MPKISVVIPVYNKQDYLLDTVNSVLKQDFQDFELLIINDGSTDNSQVIIDSFQDSRIRKVHQKNQGVSKSRNLGVTLAKAPLIAFLDADDIWYSHHLHSIYDLYQKFPEAGFYATAYRVQYNQKLQKDFVFQFETNPILLHRFYQYLRGSFLFYTSNFAIKKDIFLQEKGFKPDIDSEDAELFLQLGTKYPMAYNNTVSLLHIYDAKNSLLRSYTPRKRELLYQSFKEIEKHDADLKHYLDLDRFSLSIAYKLSGEENLAKKLIRQIDKNNLNYKQKLLLQLPNFLLRFLKKIQSVIQQKGLYFTVFKG